MTDYTSLTEKNARHSSVANLQVTNVRVNIILSKKKNLKEKAGRLL